MNIDRRFQRGITIVEYAIAGAIISLATIGAFGTLGDTVGDSIGKISVSIDDGNSGSSDPVPGAGEPNGNGTSGGTDAAGDSGASGGTNAAGGAGASDNTGAAGGSGASGGTGTASGSGASGGTGTASGSGASGGTGTASGSGASGGTGTASGSGASGGTNAAGGAGASDNTGAASDTGAPDNTGSSVNVVYLDDSRHEAGVDDERLLIASEDFGSKQALINGLPVNISSHETRPDGSGKAVNNPGGITLWWLGILLVLVLMYLLRKKVQLHRANRKLKV